MAWYRAGTVAVTNGSTNVTGSGTSWVAGVGIGEAFYGPDGRTYEIASIVSATQLTLGSAYQGTTQTGQAYQIIPTQSYIRDLAAQAAQLVADYAGFASNAGAGKFGDGTVTSPGVRFTSDENTGIRRAGIDDMRLVANGADQATINASGLSVADDRLRITGSADATKVAQFEVDGFTTATTRTFTLPNASTTVVGTDTTQTLTNKTINLASNTLLATSAQLASAITDETGTGALVFGTSPTLTTPAITGGTINNTVIGGTTRAAGNFTTLDANGNVTLGDASTDTVQVNGYVGVGSVGTPSAGVYVGSAALTTTGQFGVYSAPTFTSAGTSTIWAFRSSPATAAAAYTVSQAVGYRANDFTKGSGSIITDLHGVFVADQTQGTNNFGVTSTVTSGANKWNIYASGTAANYFAGNVGVGTTSPFNEANYRTVTVSGDDGGALRLVNTAATVAYEMKAVGATLRFGSVTNHPITFRTNDTERVRIDSSGNVLVGTTTNTNSTLMVVNGEISETTNSVQYKLVNQSDIGTAPNEIPLNQYLGSMAYEDHDNVAITGGVVAVNAGAAATPSLSITGDTDTGLWSPAANTLAASTGGTERLRIDSSGNLGLGVTPSAWGSGVRAFDMGSAGGISGSSTTTSVAFNTFWNGTNFLYKTSAAALDYRQAVGQHAWYIAPSGTAGNTISFTQAMTLDASGRLLVGTTAYPTDDNSALGFGANSTGEVRAAVINGSAAMFKRASSDGDIVVLRRDSSVAGTIGCAAGGIYFASGGTTERLRIDASGNQFCTQPAPAAVNTTATLTVANLRTRIITSTTAAAVTGTLPTGTDMDTLYSGATDMGYDWSVINTGPNGFTVAAGTGHTVVGNMTVAANTSGSFRSRRTAAATWITYRVA